VSVRELSTGVSRQDTLRGLGIEPIVVGRHDVLDGVNAVRRMLDRCWLDEERCKRGLEALRQYRREWDDKLKDYKRGPLHDWTSHGADALRTFAAGYVERGTIARKRERYRVKARTSHTWMSA
jgi:phage terminase large subunit